MINPGRSWKRYAAACIISAAFAAAPAFAGTEYKAAASENTAPGQLLVRFRDGSAAHAVVQQIAPGASTTPVRPDKNIHLVNLPQSAPLGIASKLASLPDVLYVEPNRIRRAQGLTPNDPQLNAQWALQKIQAMQAWGLAPDNFLNSAVADSGRIRVAVLDTGVDCTHPDFMNAGGHSTDSAAGGQISWAASQTFFTTTAPTPCAWGDDFGHGTHVAGIIAASANNGQGIAGIAYPVEILIYKILNSSGTGDDGAVSRAIVAAVNNGASVISLSLGAPGYSQTVQSAINYAWQKNALVVAAGGNDSKDELFFPGGANYAMGVAATDSNDALAPFSNYGSSIAVGAPGVSILSTVPTYATQEGVTSYALMSGTSMATPHVSAAGGMLFAASPNLSAAAVRMLIEQSADSGNPGGGAGRSGYGRINLANALGGNLRRGSLGGITGQVVDVNGNPVANAQVSVAGQNVSIPNFTGLFRLNGIAPGNYPAVVSAPGYPAGYFQVGVAAGADTNFTPVLGGAPAQFSGVVSDNGQTVAGAIVAAFSNGLIQSTAVTGPGGVYNLYVQAGTYDLQTSALYHVTTTLRSQSVGPNGNTVLSLSLPAMGAISGNVTLSNGSPAANATVNVNGPQNTSVTADGNGNYSTIGLAPGSYSVTAAAAGQPNASGNIGVSADVNSILNLVVGGGASSPGSPSPGSPAPAPTPNPGPAPGDFRTIRVHAGGDALVDANGNQWSADYGYSGGNIYSDNHAVGNTNTPALYQTQRWNTFAPVQYQFSAPNGPYTVVLKFAETWFSSPGQRIFNIVVNGQQVATNFDITAAAGGADLAIDLSYSVIVTNGQITIQLNPVVSNAEINAIEIDAGSDMATGGNGAANSLTAIRLNAGGGAYTDSLGQLWSADTGFNGGYTYSVSNRIQNTSDQNLYQTERWNNSPLQYQFAAPNGYYAVRLKFSENWFNSAGQRVFNIVINGNTVERNFDIVAAGGTFTAIDRTYTTQVTNGQVAIQLVPVVSNPKIDALQIARN